MLTALIVGLALAAAPDMNGAAPPPAHTSGDQQGGQNGRNGGQNGRHPPNSQRRRHKPKPHWESDPFVKPEAGAGVNTTSQGSSTYADLGASAGFHYWRVGDPAPQWGGVTRVKGIYGTGSGIQAIDLRVGSFIGPHWRHVGLQFGPDLFWNKLDATYGEDLVPSVGVEVPVTLQLTISKTFSAFIGAAPAWLANTDRKVDWSQQKLPGFGDEFTYSIGGSAAISSYRVGASYSYHMVATGAQQSIGVNFNVVM